MCFVKTVRISQQEMKIANWSFSFILNLQGNVVCKQLGYPLGAETVSCCSAYGSVPTNFAYDNVQCVGTESTLDSCNHLNVHDCVSSEGAGVVCKRNDTTVPGIFTNIL